MLLFLSPKELCYPNPCTSKGPLRQSHKGKEAQEKALPPGGPERMESAMGSSIQFPQGSPLSPRLGPPFLHIQLSPVHTQWCWAIEGFPTPGPWSTRKNPEGLEMGAWKEMRLRQGVTDAEQTIAHLALMQPATAEPAHAKNRNEHTNTHIHTCACSHTRSC